MNELQHAPVFIVQRAPLVTIGIVAMNRAWIIEKIIESIMSQTYPHESLFVLFVDGESKDGTAEVANQRLVQCDFAGYEVIASKCNIPEGRNICVGRMRGDLLLFWDSDVIMPPEAVSKLVETLETKHVDLVTADVKRITISSTDEIVGNIDEAEGFEQQEPCVEIAVAGMGQSLLSKRIASSVSFDQDLTIHEDSDFCLRAREKGFKMLLRKDIIALDVNMNHIFYSDIYVDMPLKDALRAIRKKSKIQVYSNDFTSGWNCVADFLFENKRYLFYLAYVPASFLTIFGIFAQSYLIMLFPVYALLYFLFQIRRRGVTKGFKALVRSLLVGVPNALWVVFYCFKHKFEKQNL